MAMAQVGSRFALGDVPCQITDIRNRRVWFSTDDGEPGWIPLRCLSNGRGRVLALDRDNVERLQDFELYRLCAIAGVPESRVAVLADTNGLPKRQAAVAVLT